MSLARLGVVASLLGGIVGFLYFTYVRDYPLRLALLMGAALMVLGWVAVRTLDQLRRL